MKEKLLQVVGLRFGTHAAGRNAKNSLIGTISADRGESLIVVGPVGCGKSEAAVCISGLREAGEWSGKMRFNGAEWDSLGPLRRAELVALVPSNPSLVFSCISNSVLREMEFSFEFLGRNVDSTAILSLLDRLELRPLSDRNPITLSGGEKIRAAIAVCLAKSPEILVVDQVFEELDSISERLIRSVLNHEKKTRGLIVIEFHSRAPTSPEIQDHNWMFITPDGLVQGSFADCWRAVAGSAPDLLPQFPRAGARLQQRYGVNYGSPPLSAAAVAGPFVKRNGVELLKRSEPHGVSESSQNVAAIVRDLEFTYCGKTAFCLGPISHSFPAGRATAVLGRNGAGKTTLLRCLGNVNQGWHGEVSLGANGPTKSDPLHVWARHALYCFQNPDDQLFFTTVRVELSETAQRIRDNKFPVDEEVDRVASGLGLASHLDASPLDLPRAFRRLVTLGSALVASPRLLLLDEPTGGLDEMLAKRLIRLFQDYLTAGGTIVMVSHDYDFVAELADDVLVLEGGKIESVGSREGGFDVWPGNSVPGVLAVGKSLGLPRDIWREAELLQHIAPRKIS